VPCHPPGYHSSSASPGPLTAPRRERRRSRTLSAKLLLHLVPEDEGKDGSRPGTGREPVAQCAVGGEAEVTPAGSGGRPGPAAPPSGRRGGKRRRFPAKEGRGGDGGAGAAGRSGRHHVWRRASIPGRRNGAAGRNGGNAGGRAFTSPAGTSRGLWHGGSARSPSPPWEGCLGLSAPLRHPGLAASAPWAGCRCAGWQRDECCFVLLYLKRVPQS